MDGGAKTDEGYVVAGKTVFMEVRVELEWDPLG